mmetsp:Transcript_2684/g.5117  ORF Transcript_2684/g.5117 Transcript_2684/m.5117 type:complete len:249 (+) Transcript_2684:41-787(+)
MNILKMWHSQTQVWTLMEETAATLKKERGIMDPLPYYSRVAMLRLDVIFMTPIDVYRVPDERAPDRYPKENTRWGATFKTPMRSPRIRSDYYFHDIDNKYAVVPGFASFPINDRMFMGPYNAVKLWSTARWDLYKHHVHHVLPGRDPDEWDKGLHDECLLAYTMVPAIRNKTQTDIMVDKFLYFLRVRADGSIWVLDSPYHGAETEQPKLEELLGRNCTKPFKVRGKGISPIAKWQVKCPVLQTKYDQ